ncbi:unsaturated rhamnogalacturonyl hydrolase [Hydrogenispora ethanolica]|jgi:unsaturated rhamnogalacturonyl hydrolase|uniref:Unsaturated rhamnogalacturonyl hydrolase n=1 Tax=Hydrogenispora ethanolica TaxID=1082276 RepID=A0A4R1RQJ2_HYDET|nr:glycoside hydrolase family 88 protein [Hydrogenispora ethanolica]TCL68574.1 unsaturated rhamnogalacturonyl hydrolase [Hydrogenispora ethanolica]
MNHTPNIRETAERVINRLIRTAKGDGSNDHLVIETWEWPQGVALYSLFKYYRHTGDSKQLDFINHWFEQRFAEAEPPKNVNTVAPLLTLIHLYELTGDPRTLRICTEWAEWVMREMPRTEEGGLQHITSHDRNEQQLWDDTLFMTVLFLAKFGKATRSEAYIQEAIYQFLLHIKYLYDPATGLWFHGWTFRERNHFADALWARGNCWFTAGVVEFLEILGLDGALRRHLVDTLKAQVKKLAELQDASGLWHTLLDDPHSYLETSASAGFAYGILKAVRLGYLAPEYAAVGRKAADGVLAKIDSDGTVQGVSYGTAMGSDLDHYRRIKICPTSYGQGLAFLLCTELVREQ